MTHTTRPAPADAGAGPFMPTALDILNDPALRPSAGGTGFQTALDRCPLGLEDLPDHLAAIAVGELRRVWVAALLDALLAEAGHREWFGDVARALGVVSRRLYRAEFDDAIAIKETTMTQPQMGFPAGRRGQGPTPEQAAAAKAARAVVVPASAATRDAIDGFGAARGPDLVMREGVVSAGPGAPAESKSSVQPWRRAEMHRKPTLVEMATVAQESETELGLVVNADAPRPATKGARTLSELRDRLASIRRRVSEAGAMTLRAERLKAEAVLDLVDLAHQALLPGDFPPIERDVPERPAPEPGLAEQDPTWSERLNAGIARARAAAAPSAAEAIRDAIAAMPGDFTVNDVWERAQEARPGMARENVANLIRAQVDAKALRVVKPGGRGVAGVYRRAGGAGGGA